MKKLFCVLLILTLTNCGGIPQTTTHIVHAGPPVPYIGGCPIKAGPNIGLFGTFIEYPGHQISLVDTACSLIVPQPPETDAQELDSCGKDQVVSLITTTTLHVHSARLWIGAGVDSRFETGVCLVVTSPTGEVLKVLRREWDKHIEEHLSDQPFVVDFIIPAGSKIQLSREPHATISCPATSSICATQEMADLYGE